MGTYSGFIVLSTLCMCLKFSIMKRFFFLQKSFPSGLDNQPGLGGTIHSSHLTGEKLKVTVPRSSFVGSRTHGSASEAQRVTPRCLFNGPFYWPFWNLKAHSAIWFLWLNCFLETTGEFCKDCFFPHKFSSSICTYSHSVRLQDKHWLFQRRLGCVCLATESSNKRWDVSPCESICTRVNERMNDWLDKGAEKCSAYVWVSRGWCTEQPNPHQKRERPATSWKIKTTGLWPGLVSPINLA